MSGFQTIFSQTVLFRLTILLSLAIAIACLWPFLPPRNTASWVAGRRGVAFGKHGVLLGPGPLQPPNAAVSGCTLDLWVEPDKADTTGVILAAYSRANPRLLQVEQLRDGLAVRRAEPVDPLRTGGAQLYADGVFASGKPVLLTITSDGRGTKAFVNGTFRKAAPDFQICNGMLTGKFVAGTGAASDYGWQGRLAGIAIFSRPLSPGELREDYNISPGYPSPVFGNRRGLVALYRFDEGSGIRVRDEVSGDNSFSMPARYIVVAKSLLSPPSFDNPTDIVSNVIGFIPLGFALYGHLSFRGRKGPRVVAAVLLCGLFSLLIETLQWFLPTRDSDMTDVITNTVGAACGVLLYVLLDRLNRRPPSAMKS